MTSKVSDSTDVALGVFSVSSSVVTAGAVLASPDKNLSESMLWVRRYFKSHIPPSLLPTLPYNTNRTLQLGILFAGLTTFWFTQMVIYFRRGRSPTSIGPAFILSIILLLLAKFNLAEYLLVCLPISLSIGDVAILATSYRRSRNQRKVLISESSKDKKSAMGS